MKLPFGNPHPPVKTGNADLDKWVEETALYLTKLTQFLEKLTVVASSAGSGDAGKLVKLNASGKVDATML